MRLESWLERERKTPTDFARSIDVDPSTITRLLPGDAKRQVRKPGREVMAKIYTATGGEVSPNDYLDVELGVSSHDPESAEPSLARA